MTINGQAIQKLLNNCSVCNEPATHLTRNLYRENKGDGTIAYAAAGDCFWRCDAHRQEAILLFGIIPSISGEIR